MTPSQNRAIQRAAAKGHVDHWNRGSLPPEVRQSLDEHVPRNQQCIVRRAKTVHGEIYWYHDWVYER